MNVMNMHWDNIKFFIGIVIFFLSCSTVFPQIPGQTLNIGYSAKLFSGIDLNDAQVAIDLWSKELAKSINDKFSFNYTVRSLIIEENKYYLEAPNTVEMALLSVTALDFVRFHNKATWIPMFSTSSKGEFPEPLIILVNKNKPFNSLKDLHNKNIQVPDNSTLPLINLWLDNLLLTESNQTHTQFFNEVKKSIKPSKAVLNVFFGKADACVVGSNTFTTMTELNPQLGNTLKIIKKSPPFLNRISCLNTALEKKLRDLMMTTAVNLPSNPKGKQFLTLFNGDKVIRFKEEYIKSLNGLVNTNKKLILINKIKQ